MALSRDPAATAAANLNVLRRMDPEVEEVLGRAGHVCLYNFDTSTQQWVRLLHYHSAALQGAVSRVASERESPAVAVTWPSSYSLPVRVRRRASAIWRALCLLSGGVFQRRALREERRLTPKGARTPLSHTQEHAAPLPVHHPEPTQHRRGMRRACL